MDFVSRDAYPFPHGVTQVATNSASPSTLPNVNSVWPQSFCASSPSTSEDRMDCDEELWVMEDLLAEEHGMASDVPMASISSDDTEDFGFGSPMKIDIDSFSPAFVHTGPPNISLFAPFVEEQNKFLPYHQAKTANSLERNTQSTFDFISFGVPVTDMELRLSPPSTTRRLSHVDIGYSVEGTRNFDTLGFDLTPPWLIQPEGETTLSGCDLSIVENVNGPFSDENTPDIFRDGSTASLYPGSFRISELCTKEPASAMPAPCLDSPCLPLPEEIPQYANYPGSPSHSCCIDELDVDVDEARQNLPIVTVKDAIHRLKLPFGRASHNDNLLAADFWKPYSVVPPLSGNPMPGFETVVLDSPSFETRLTKAIRNSGSISSPGNVHHLHGELGFAAQNGAWDSQGPPDGKAHSRTLGGKGNMDGDESGPSANVFPSNNSSPGTSSGKSSLVSPPVVSLPCPHSTSKSVSKRPEKVTDNRKSTPPSSDDPKRLEKSSVRDPRPIPAWVQRSVPARSLVAFAQFPPVTPPTTPRSVCVEPTKQQLLILDHCRQKWSPLHSIEGSNPNNARASTHKNTGDDMSVRESMNAPFRAVTRWIFGFDDEYMAVGGVYQKGRRVMYKAHERLSKRLFGW